jgi:hypothetical protein
MGRQPQRILCRSMLSHLACCFLWGVWIGGWDFSHRNICFFTLLLDKGSQTEISGRKQLG